MRLWAPSADDLGTMEVLFIWLIDWLIDLLNNWIIDWLIDWLIDWFIDLLIYWSVDRLIESFIPSFIPSFIHSFIHPLLNCIYDTPPPSKEPFLRISKTRLNRIWAGVVQKVYKCFVFACKLKRVGHGFELLCSSPFCAGRTHRAETGHFIGGYI